MLSKLNARFSTKVKTSLLFVINSQPGSLARCLNILAENNINISYIKSKPHKFFNPNYEKFDFFVDIEGHIDDSNVQNALKSLEAHTHNIKLNELEKSPWFPKNLTDLNQIGRTLLKAGEELDSDHPGFNDLEYRQRRNELAKLSNSYELTQLLDYPYPHVEYTQKEKDVWKYCWDKLKPIHEKYACAEYLKCFKEMEEECNFNKNEIPQLGTISKFLLNKTNTLFRPVGGLLSQREFLNGLAFRVFHSTQYIRHHSVPLYTPEPDIIHEYIGHAPMFADPDFADFSQEMGLASLGASDEDVEKLGNIYWFTIEFGLCQQNNELKIYGGGILSSVSETEWSVSGKPSYLDIDLKKMGSFPYKITEIQKTYFVASSFEDIKNKIIKYAENIPKEFNVSYDSVNKQVEIDRNIKI